MTLISYQSTMYRDQNMHYKNFNQKIRLERMSYPVQFKLSLCIKPTHCLYCCHMLIHHSHSISVLFNFSTLRFLPSIIFSDLYFTVNLQYFIKWWPSIISFAFVSFVNLINLSLVQDRREKD